MAKSVEYGTYIIDLTGAMLEHRRRLEPNQVEHIKLIRNNAVNFVTDYLRHENAPLDRLMKFLSYDAQSSITIIIRACEMLSAGMYGELPGAFKEAIREIGDCGYAMHDDIQTTKEELEQFMTTIGLEIGIR